MKFPLEEFDPGFEKMVEKLVRTVGIFLGPGTEVFPISNEAVLCGKCISKYHLKKIKGYSVDFAIQKDVGIYGIYACAECDSIISDDRIIKADEAFTDRKHFKSVIREFSNKAIAQSILISSLLHFNECGTKDTDKGFAVPKRIALKVKQAAAGRKIKGGKKCSL